MDRSDKFSDPCNLFVIKQNNQELEPQTKAELVTKMSPILFDIIIAVLEGTYQVGTVTKSLKVIDQQIEYEFIALAEDSPEGQSKSPLVFLQQLRDQFE